MTSEVIPIAHIVGHLEPEMSKTAATLVLLPFFAFSLYVTWMRGYTGFITLSWEEPWAAQMLMDLTIALTFVMTWIVGDCRRRGTAAWPWIVGTLLSGSIAPLVYVATGRHRAAK